MAAADRQSRLTDSCSRPTAVSAATRRARMDTAGPGTSCRDSPGRQRRRGELPVLPVPLIFTSGAASGVNCYAVVLLLGLIGRFGHVGAIPPVLEKPSVLIAAAVLYGGQFVAGKVPYLDSIWDIVHTAVRPVVGGAIGVVMAHHAHTRPTDAVIAAALGGGSALASHVVKTGMRVGINASPEPV